MHLRCATTNLKGSVVNSGGKRWHPSPVYAKQQQGQPQPLVTVCSSSSNTPSSSSSPGDSEISSYAYNSEDGIKQKATLEKLGALYGYNGNLGSDDGVVGADRSSTAPWMVGWQMSERNLLWNDELKMKLIQRIASEELGVSDEEMEWRMRELLVLLPGLQARLMAAPPKLVARLAAHTSEVAGRMCRLKELFPEANLAEMVNNRLSLMLDDDMDQVSRAAGQLRALLPGINVDRFAEAFPVVLDYDSFHMAVQDAQRIMPDMNLQDMLRRNPDTILSLVKGKALIPYDEISNPWS